MSETPWRFHLALLIGCAGSFLIGLPEVSQASLGGAPEIPQPEAVQGSIIHRSLTQLDKYSIQELRTEMGIVREYYSTENIVFAVVWRGQSTPDLNQYLGSFWSEYQQALKRSPRIKGLRQRVLKTGRLVVEKWGHMRKLQGRAYAPALLPPGVSPDEIK